MNHKSLLNEYIQKNKSSVCDLKYTSTSQGPAHLPTFVSRVELTVDGTLRAPDAPRRGTQVSFENDSGGKTKTMAEEGAAKLMYEFLTRRRTQSREVIPSSSQRAHKIFVDLENVQLSSFPINGPSNFEAWCFTSEFSNVKEFIPAPNVHMVKVGSAVKDASDHAMSYFAGKIMSTIPDEQRREYAVVIISGDKFSSVLRVLLESDGFKEVVQLKNKRDVEDFFSR